jgi:hypothetical protein
MKRWSVTEAGSFSESEMIQITGIRAKSRTMARPIDHSTRSRGL